MPGSPRRSSRRIRRGRRQRSAAGRQGGFVHTRVALSPSGRTRRRGGTVLGSRIRSEGSLGMTRPTRIRLAIVGAALAAVAFAASAAAVGPIAYEKGVFVDQQLAGGEPFVYA